ncbi:MAG: efflux RND transporter permease subunit [Flavobacteriales bacterium]|nr:efflux RND transporter permease subunit [Flavobacteriales bacterium]
MAKIQEIIKEFKLSSWSVQNRISVYVMVFIILVIGWRSYSTMPKESFPEIKQPTIYINTVYPGNSPVDMENLVTRPIEKELNTINGIKKLSSTSIQDFSIIIAEFDLDVPSNEALQEVKDAVDRADAELPNDLPADPSIMELDFSEMPVMNVNVYGNYPEEKLKEYSEYLEDEIEKLPEISAVDITGLTEDEVEVSVDRIKMEALEITLTDVERAIAGENITMSGGDIRSIDGGDITRRNIRINGEFKDYRDILDVIVKNEFQNIVYMRDIGTVSFGPKEPTSFARLDGKPVVALDVKKKSGENLLNAAEKIRAIIADAQENRFPKDLNVLITNDQSKFTKSMVNNLENSIIMGVLLVVGVLVFFLGLRNSLFVGIAIPLSMLMGIALLNFGGNTLNMMVLFSLILALGMLVDNGIVVVENIYRLRTTTSLSQEDSSKQGVGEVASAIIASTATTLAAFVPLLFWKDLMGEFMKFLPITLIIVLASSLFVALVVNPVLTADMMDIEEAKQSKAKKFFTRLILALIVGVIFILVGRNMRSADAEGVNGTNMILLGALFLVGVLFALVNRYYMIPVGNHFMKYTMPKIENWYSRRVEFALRGYRPLLYFLGTVLLMILSLGFYFSSDPEIVFFPENEPKMVNVFVETPLGTDIEKTNEITKKLEQRIAAEVAPDSVIVEAMLAQVGEKTSDPNEGPQSGSSPNKARITVSFLDYEERVFLSDTKTSELMTRIKKACSDFPEAELTFSKDNMGPPVGKPINVEVKGENYLELISYVESIKRKMEDARIPGVDQLKTDLELGKPMLEVTIDREAARRFGVSTMDIANTLRVANQGKEISKFKEGEDDYEINLRFLDAYRYNLNDLLNTKITFRNMATGKISQVPISAVADVRFNSTYGTVKRLDMDRVITIFSEVEEGFNANEIVGQYKELLSDFPKKEGYEFKFTGEQEEQGKSQDFLMGAMMLAMFIIFLIIVTQFNSVIGPLIIMCSVIFSIIGVFLGFGIARMPFSIMMSGIGIISLAGVVVNNAIVLIDYTILLRQRRRAELGIPDNGRLPYDEIVGTIVEAGRTRLRPVLLTAITTVLGLLPLATGMNINFYTLLTEFDAQIYFGGDNANFWGPMAWTVIFGLIFATFLTLIIVPVMYMMSDRATVKVKSLVGGLVKEEDVENTNIGTVPD